VLLPRAADATCFELPPPARTINARAARRPAPTVATGAPAGLEDEKCKTNSAGSRRGAARVRPCRRPCRLASLRFGWNAKVQNELPARIRNRVVQGAALRVPYPRGGGADRAIV